MPSSFHRCLRALLLPVVLLVPISVPAAPAATEPVAAELRTRLAAPDALAGEALRERPLLARFYAARAGKPAWSEPRLLDALLAAVDKSPEDGLDAGDYHRARLATAIDAARRGRLDATGLAALDVLATDAWLALAQDLLSGRLDPQQLDKDWTLRQRSRDLVAALNEALANRRIGESLAALAPAYPEYAQLRRGLAELRRQLAAGGWPTVGALAKGEKIEPGQPHPRVREIRARLLATKEVEATTPVLAPVSVPVPAPAAPAAATTAAGGETAATPAQPAAAEPAPVETVLAEVYDATLVEAVHRFQARHGLTEDGVIGAATVAAMNVSVRERIAQVRLNLERWRWLPGDLGQRYIVVNIPGFELQVIERGRPVLEAKVVVGTQVKPTPVFTGRMQQVVFAPYWNVPGTIASEELLPKLRKNPGEFVKTNMKVITGSGAVVDPTAVNWGEYHPGNFPFRLRQEPGAANPLGRVKFIFPNRYDVYLHDTSKPALFERSQRTYSHGCIRISRPAELAEYLLNSDPRWNRAAIDAAMDAGRERAVPVPEPLPVHLLYWTSWVDAQGLLQFRADVYGRDLALRKALSAL